MRTHLPLILVLTGLALWSDAALAAGSNMPWEAPLQAILLAGAPRGIAILNGTLAAALGLGLQLWIAGLVVWVLGHTAAVYAAKYDPQFPDVLARHLEQRAYLSC